VHAYVINLARSVDRRAHMTAELKKTGMSYEIITAVEGRDLDLSDPAIVDPSLPNWTKTLATTTGAALSHLIAYKKIVADGLDQGLVLEDDVLLPNDLESLADAVADQLTGAEVALLSVDSIDPCRVSREGSVPLPSSRLLALPIDVYRPRSGGAYVITREACERMIKCMPPVRMNIDDWWFHYREGVLDRVRCVVPIPVHKNPKLISTMGSYSLGNGLKARLFWPLVRLKIPIVHQVLCYRRQRIYRQWSRSELVDVPFVEKPSRLE
jgi:glycosyl transferase, family 25